MGQWERGSICGSGEMSYNREVKRGRAKVVEKNKLTGEFVNGIFQGRLTSPYSDELIWEPYRLKAENFKAVKSEYFPSLPITLITFFNFLSGCPSFERTNFILLRSKFIDLLNNLLLTS